MKLWSVLIGLGKIICSMSFVNIIAFRAEAEVILAESIEIFRTIFPRQLGDEN